MPIDAIGDTPRIERCALGDETSSNHPIKVVGRDDSDGEHVLYLVHNSHEIHPMGLMSMTIEATGAVIDNLREALKRRSLKLSVVSTELNIPYRSLQNYFSGRSEMPLSVYARICELARIPIDYPFNGLRFKLSLHALQDALIEVFGDHIPSVITENGNLSLSVGVPPAQERDAASLRRDAITLAIFLESKYDLAQEREMTTPWNEE